MHRAFRRLTAVIALVAALGVALALPAAQSDRTSAEADLAALKERIARVQRQMQQDTVEKNRQSRALRDAERQVSRAQGELRDLRSQRAQRQETRRELLADREASEVSRRATETDLAAQLKAAYMMGRNEPLKLLLNQGSPAEFSRNLAYYGYFGRLRARQIDDIKTDIANIDELTTKIEAEEAELQRLEGAQKQRVGELEDASRERSKALASLEKEASNRAASLRRLQAQQREMEELIRRLAKAAESVPYDAKAPFAKVKGGISWPVAGRIAVNFGETPAGGVRSNGIEIDTERGGEVRAIHEGRVIYADWMNLLGQLIIIDHGGGYWSLYGHTEEQLFKRQGDTVKAGDVIATVGDSGGRKRPGLYFEVRQNGKPVDPRGWFKSKTPPAR